MSDSGAEPITLVLGGGGGRGLAHVGVWRAVQESAIPVARVLGSSSGALIGASIAAGTSWQDLSSMAKRLARNSIFSLDPKILYRGARSAGLLKESPLRTLIAELVSVVRFDQLPIPLSVSAIDLVSGEIAWFGQGGRDDVSVPDAVYASCALPFLFPPARMLGSLYVDAGIVDPLPVSHAQALGREPVVAVDLAASAQVSPEGAGLFDTYRRVFEILRPPLANPDGAATEPIRIHPTVAGRSTFDVAQADRLIEAGYRAAQASLAGLALPAAAPAPAAASRWRPNPNGVSARVRRMIWPATGAATPSPSLTRSL